MSFFLDNWMLFAIALASGGMLMFPALTSGGGAAGLTPAEVVQLINREKAAVVDVCGPDEFAAGHVTGAKNVPLPELEAKLAEAASKESIILVNLSGRGDKDVAQAEALLGRRP